MSQSIRRLLVAGALSGVLAGAAACSGDDGAAGAAGPAGMDGADGSDGDRGPAGADGADGDNGSSGEPGMDGMPGADGRPGSSDPVVPGLTRLATAPLGAEFTGIELNAEGDLFFNAQHPSDANDIEVDGKVFNLGTVGVITGFDFNRLPRVFTGVPVPVVESEKEVMQVALGGYQVLGQEGDGFDGQIPNGLGAMLTPDGTAVVKASNDPDFNSYIPDGTGHGYLFTNWEDRPGGMSRLEITKGVDGRWTVDAAMMVDFTAVEGTWVNCYGSTSPWATPLTAEENYSSYETAEWNNPAGDLATDVAALEQHIGKFPNPYRYGYIVEITDPTGTPTPVKHFTTGRFAHENAVVMPDERTVYLTDDGTGGMFFKFVAGTAGDLSAGTLYAAKVTQDSSTDPLITGFDIQWIELGSSNNAEIEGWIAEYDGIDTGDYTDGETSYISQGDIDAWAAGSAADDRVAFLHPREAGLAKGATAEWRKKEGIQFSFARAIEAIEGTDMVPGEAVMQAYLYMAMSNINATMTDGEGDIQLSGRVDECGGIYRMPIEAGYDISRIEPALMGGPYTGDRPDNTCNVNNIAEPDNVIVLDDGRVVIGEDTGEHENNMLWVWDPSVWF